MEQLIATRSKRSEKFRNALWLKEQGFDPEHPGHRQTLIEAYEEAKILLEPLHLKRLKEKDLDQRFLELLEFVIIPYHRLVSQHGMEFFERLRKNGGDFEELAMLRMRRHDLVEHWRETYSKRRPNVAYEKESDE